VRLVLRAFCALLIAGLLTGAVAVGGGAPLSPAAIARAAGQAADNLDRAEANTERAAEDTEALARIARNVASQLDTSRRLLRTQLEIEATSEEGGGLSKELLRELAGLRSTLQGVEGRLRSVAGLSEKVTEEARASISAAAGLREALGVLQERFGVALKQSRKLNQKARAFDEVTP
jgi:hypothetical protein